MLNGMISGRTVVAGVVGWPVRHSLSPVIHNAWLAQAGLDGVYVAFAPGPDDFSRFVLGLRGAVIRGLNVTAPFKEQALALADQSTSRARAAGSANLLVFEADGVIQADNTDGEGLLDAFMRQAPGFDPAASPVVILGAGGAARGAGAAFLAAGAPRVDFVNRTAARAEALAAMFGERARGLGLAQTPLACADAGVLINAVSPGPDGDAGARAPLADLPAGCVVMDMVYRPLRTPLLVAAQARGLRTVDGLGMLIGQAVPSFRAFFGADPPDFDIRAHVLAALEIPE